MNHTQNHISAEDLNLYIRSVYRITPIRIYLLQEKKKEFILCLLGTPLKQRKNQRSICWIASRSDRK